MSSKKRLTTSLAAAVTVSVLAACASAPAPDVSPEAAATWTPATAEARDAADRAPPLNRVAFWSDEFEKTPEDLDTAIRFLDALMAIKSYERAVEVAVQTSVVHPAAPELLTRWGTALSREDRYREALEVYTRASDLDPGNAKAFAGLGAALDHLGEHGRAQVAYNRALSLEPDRVSTLTNLGLSLMLSGDLDGAAEKLERAASLPGANAKVRQNLALVLGLRGDLNEARQVALRDAPSDLVDRNLGIIRSLKAPVRDWGALGEEEDLPKEDAVQNDAPVLRGSLSTGD